MIRQLEDLVVGVGYSVGSRDRVIVYFVLEFFVGLVAEALEEERSEVPPLGLGGSCLVFRQVGAIVRAVVVRCLYFVIHNLCSGLVEPTPQPSSTFSEWTRKCSSSTKSQPNHCRAISRSSKVLLMLSNCRTDPHGPTRPPQRSCTTNSKCQATTPQPRAPT